MATIHGFTLKNMKSWTGREGIGTAATVYLNGEKLGEWICDGEGSICDRFEFNHRKLESLLREQFPEECKYTNDNYAPNLQELLAKLADLTEFEMRNRKASGSFNVAYNIGEPLQV